MVLRSSNFLKRADTERLTPASSRVLCAEFSMTWRLEADFVQIDDKEKGDTLMKTKNPRNMARADEITSAPKDVGVEEGMQWTDDLLAALQSAIALDIKPEEALRYDYKSKVERELGRIVRQVAGRLPGTTFGEVATQPTRK